ncbi:hypothetical protein SNEBB_008636 [Seison nebaliae]|nr:hypothetical protein SNEBB_008636 [Seison nebaliae]
MSYERDKIEIFLELNSLKQKPSIDETITLIELYKTPKFSKENSMELPNKINLSNLIEEILDAKRNGNRKRTRTTKKVKKLLQLNKQFNIIIDIFHWYFINEFELIRKKTSPSEKKEFQLTLKQLFDRISDLYVELFNVSDKSLIEDKNQVLEELPDDISRIIYSLFAEAFPASRNQYCTNQFKKNLVKLIFHWFHGCQVNEQNYYSQWSIKEHASSSTNSNNDKSSKKQFVKEVEIELNRQEMISKRRGYKYSLKSVTAQLQAAKKLGMIHEDNQRRQEEAITKRFRFSYNPNIKLRSREKMLEDSKAISNLELSEDFFNINGTSPLILYHLSKKFQSESLKRKEAYSQIVREKQVRNIMSGNNTSMGKLIFQLSQLPDIRRHKSCEIKLHEEELKYKLDVPNIYREFINEMKSTQITKKQFTVPKSPLRPRSRPITEATKIYYSLTNVNESSTIGKDIFVKHKTKQKDKISPYSFSEVSTTYSHNQEKLQKNIEKCESDCRCESRRSLRILKKDLNQLDDVRTRLLQNRQQVKQLSSLILLNLESDKKGGNNDARLAIKEVLSSTK